MSDDKQQKFTSKVRRGLVWVHAQASAEMARLKASSTNTKVPGFNAAELADVEAALLWIEQNKEGASS